MVLATLIFLQQEMLKKYPATNLEQIFKDDDNRKFKMLLTRIKP
jgi:uncharacterized pyridoxamine 5'-phosphate oxidase family protein